MVKVQSAHTMLLICSWESKRVKLECKRERALAKLAKLIDIRVKSHLCKDSFTTALYRACILGNTEYLSP